LQVTPKFCKQYAYRIDKAQTNAFLNELEKRGFHEAAEAASEAAVQDEQAGEPHIKTLPD
jgi:hypothetical protein